MNAPTGHSPFEPRKSLAETVAELHPNIAAGLAAILPPISGIIFLVSERKRSLVRFHALQNIIFGVAGLFILSALNIFRGLEILPIIGGIFSILVRLLSVILGLTFLGVYSVVILQAFMGAQWQIPKLGRLTQKILLGFSKEEH